MIFFLIDKIKKKQKKKLLPTNSGNVNFLLLYFIVELNSFHEMFQNVNINVIVFFL